MSDLPSREEITEAAAIADQLRIYQHKGKTDCITYGNADPRVILTILRMARFALSGRLVDRETITNEQAVERVAESRYNARFGGFAWTDPDFVTHGHTRDAFMASARRDLAAAIGDTG